MSIYKATKILLLLREKNTHVELLYFTCSIFILAISLLLRQPGGPVLSENNVDDSAEIQKALHTTAQNS